MSGPPIGSSLPSLHRLEAVLEPLVEVRLRRLRDQQEFDVLRRGHGQQQQQQRQRGEGRGSHGDVAVEATLTAYSMLEIDRGGKEEEEDFVALRGLFKCRLISLSVTEQCGPILALLCAVID